MPHFFPGNIEKTIGELQSRFSFYSGLVGALSLNFFYRLIEIYFSLSVIFPFFFFRFVFVYVVGSRQRGQVRRRRGCRRMLAGRGWVARNAVAVFVARRRVRPERKGKHEYALSGLLLKSYTEYVRHLKGCSGLQAKSQAVLM